MFKRIALVLTFLATISAAGLVAPSQAEARRWWRRPYSSYYYGPPRSYYYGFYNRPYGTFYSPRAYRPYYYGRYYGPGYYYGRPGISIGVGF